MVSKCAILLLASIINFISCYPAHNELVDPEGGFQVFEEEPLEVVDVEQQQLRQIRNVYKNALLGFQPDGEIRYLEQPLIRERRQLFGGLSGAQHTVGYRNGPAWGSMSHSGGPIQYSGGVDLTRGPFSLSGSLSHIPHQGGQGSIGGSANLLNTPNHQLSAWAEHSRNLDQNMHRVGPETNRAGLNYEHNSGATAFVSGTKIPGSPSTGSFGGSIPLYKGKDTTVSIGAQTDVGNGKPRHQGTLNVETTF